jgi:hypothetical protein
LIPQTDGWGVVTTDYETPQKICQEDIIGQGNDPAALEARCEYQ